MFPVQINSIGSTKALLNHNGPDPPQGDQGDPLLEDPQAAAPPPSPLVQAVAPTGWAEKQKNDSLKYADVDYYGNLYIKQGSIEKNGIF